MYIAVLYMTLKSHYISFSRHLVPGKTASCWGTYPLPVPSCPIPGRAYSDTAVWKQVQTLHDYHWHVFSTHLAFSMQESGIIHMNLYKK